MRRCILNVIWEDKKVLVLRGAAVTVEDVEVRKECACIEGREHTIRASVTQPGREEVHTWVATRQPPWCYSQQRRSLLPRLESASDEG